MENFVDLCVIWTTSSFLSKRTVAGSLPLVMVRVILIRTRQIFDADCSHSGFDDTPFLSCNICTGLFALSQTTFAVLNLHRAFR